MSLPSRIEKERIKKLTKEIVEKMSDVEYLCPICRGHLILTTGGFWCPLHGHIPPKIIEIKKKEN